jgi:diphthine methyl ester synthase
MLSLVGVGLGNHEDITLKGLSLVKKADKIYLDVYTSFFSDNISELEKFYEKKIFLACRDVLESSQLIDESKKMDVVLLVVGDALSATTHISLILEAKKENVPVSVVYNASILTAVGITGLQLYKFGKTTSIPFWTDNYKPENFYDIIKENKIIGAHTLCLLDLSKEKCMDIRTAISILLKVEEERKENVFSEDSLCIACSRVAFKDQLIFAGPAKNLVKKDFGKPPFCLIVVGKLHFFEEDAISEFMV